MPAHSAPSLTACRRRLFLIEEDEVCGATLQHLLSQENEVRELADVPQALAYGHGKPPDAILLGIGLLVNRGRQVLDDLRSAWPDVKTLVVCDTADEADVAACLALGADGALARPLNMDSVRQAINAIFGRLTRH